MDKMNEMYTVTLRQFGDREETTITGNGNMLNKISMAFDALAKEYRRAKNIDKYNQYRELADDIFNLLHENGYYNE